MNRRILFLTQWFDPEPTFKGLVFAKELVARGFDVEVVTGFPNYPGGKVYAGYKLRWLQRETLDGVRVSRVPLYPSHDNSAIKRILNYVSFSVSAFIYGLFFARRADVIYAYHPPLTVGVVAVLLRLIRGMPVVYDIQDMWPDTLQATGMIQSRRVLGIVGVVCRFVYRFVDKIVVLSPGFKRVLTQRGVPEHKIDVIYNWADEGSLSAGCHAIPGNFPSSEKFRIVFAGNMGKAQALDSILDAAAILMERGSKVCFVMLGGGVDVARLTQRSIDMKLNNVFFLPAVPMSAVGSYLHAADALVVHLRKDPLFSITIPSKTQAYMTVCKPILMAVDGDAAELIRDAGCGVVAESENAVALADAADYIAALPTEQRGVMGRCAGDFYRRNLSLGVGVERFANIFNGYSSNRCG